MYSTIIYLISVVIINLLWYGFYNKNLSEAARNYNLLAETYTNYHKRAYSEKAEAYTKGYKDGYEACEDAEEDEWLGTDIDAALKQWKKDPEMTLRIFPFEDRPWGKN